MGKRLSLVLLALFFLLNQSLPGQNSVETDSLLQVLRFTHEPRARARLFLKIAKEEELRSPEKCLNYAKQARQVAQRAGYDSAELRAMILIGANLNRLNRLKEAIETGGEVVEKATKLDKQLEIADGRAVMAVAYAQVGDYDNSSKLYFENLRLYERQKEKRLYGSTLGNIGADFFSQQSFDKALTYTRKALQIAQEINDLPVVSDMYNNLAAIYQISYNNLPEALRYYSEALKVARKINDIQQQGIITLNMGRVYQGLENSDSAFYYMNQSLEFFEQVNNPVNMADSYIALSDFHFRKAEHALSQELALKALKIGEQFKVLQTTYQASDMLYTIYLAHGDSASALKYFITRNATSDSLYSLQSQRALFRAELQYSQEKVIKEQKLRQQKNNFVLGFVILGLISGLFIALLLYSRQKIKIRNTILERDKAEADLRFKSKELSINLLALLKKNELIAEIRQKLIDFEKALPTNEAKEVFALFNQEIKQSADDRLWQEFSVRFKEINSEFYDKLLEKFPDLTQGELKLCAYLRLNMSTKEIADLTGQRTESLEKARYRLRKKFGLTNSESNLVTFLTQL